MRNTEHILNIKEYKQYNRALHKEAFFKWAIRDHLKPNKVKIGATLVAFLIFSAIYTIAERILV
jgi:hypothetical protein